MFRFDNFENLPNLCANDRRGDPCGCHVLVFAETMATHPAFYFIFMLPVKHAALIILFLAPFFGYAQKTKFSEGHTDSLGRKQGYWRAGELRVVSSSYNGLGSVQGCRYEEVLDTTVWEEGYYQNDEKINTWKYYNNDCHNCKQKLYLLHNWQNGKIITEQNLDEGFTRHFLPNGSIHEISTAYNYDINYTLGFALVQGQALYKNDTVLVDCNNGNCTFRVGKKTFLSFLPGKLMDKLMLLSMDEYGRDIRLTKMR